MNKKHLDIAKKIVLTIVKVLWLPCLLIVALAVGLYAGYRITSPENPREIFQLEVWRNFFYQLFGN